MIRSISRREWISTAASLTCLPWRAAHPRSNLPHVLIRTDAGDIAVSVNVERAPVTGGDFLKYVRLGLFDAGEFYRIVLPDNDQNPVKISVIQGGVVDRAKELPPISHESTRQTGLKHSDGTISAARAAPGTGSAGAFFICIGDQPELDYGGHRNPDGQGFAAFGQVVDGMDVVRRIWAGKTTGRDGSMASQMLVTPVKISSVRTA